MDGFKKRLKASVQFKLSFYLSMAIVVVASVAGIFSFVGAFDEAHELQDNMLRQVAGLLDRQGIAPPYRSEEAHTHHSGGDDEARLIVQRLTGERQLGGSLDAAAPLPLPLTLADGLHTLDVRGEPFRVLVKTTSAGDRIAVAQEIGVRDEIAFEGAWRVLMPFLVLAPILLLIVAHLVRKMFRPIAALSLEIDQRAESALHPVNASHLPTEVRPFVVAINRLLARVDRSMEHQRRFVADAAHELRSPLTALSLQAERLEQAPMSDLAHERLVALRQGIERGRNLLDQLLALAKAQAALERPTSPVSVQHVYRRVLEDLMPLAEAKHIDIGVEGEQDAQLWASELDVMAVVKNLVDNAIRYTPDHGRVDLGITLHEGCVLLRIQDSGPGIELAERERVFDPFYRTLGSDQVGSGLGLSIVKTIIDRIGATLELSFTNEATRTGLRVQVRVPLAPPLALASLGL